MADVVFVCVREDMDRAEALAEMFAAGGLTVHEGKLNNAALCLAGAAIVVWSKLAQKSQGFMAATEQAIEQGKAVLVCFSELPEDIGDIVNFDLRSWDGAATSELLHPVFFAVDHMATHNRDELAVEDSEGLPLAEGWTAELPTTPISAIPVTRLVNLEAAPTAPSPPRTLGDGSGRVVKLELTVDPEIQNLVNYDVAF